LISRAFGSYPEFLWITLLIVASGAAEGLVNQGLRYFARKKGTEQNPYKSMTYGFCKG
jgi:hypothetical protein